MTKKVNQLSDSFDVNMWQIFDISLFGRDKDRVLNIIGNKLDSGTKKYWVATVNPEFVMESLKDKKFGQILQSRTQLNIVDGIGLVWAREVVGKNFVGKLFSGFRVGMKVLGGIYKNKIVSGADLVLDLSRMTAEKGLKMFFLGGFGNRAQKTAEFLKNEFGLKQEQLDWCEGEPNISNEEVIEKINKFRPNILLVAYGMKKQEFWIADNLKKLDVGLVMGVGRSFDYYSGELKRAPKWCQRMGLEWLYSLIKEPKRIKRQLVLPKFIWKVLTK
ncbi:MAG: WecB/TagA/CpsF family glycosyltransferase [Candidatus Shapirobacteria bacterium]|jgi:N-acetylglucosaminyldiphosphoundecaprenol N-acetyl-beta-D-mannosaminyltransferase